MHCNDLHPKSWDGARSVRDNGLTNRPPHPKVIPMKPVRRLAAAALVTAFGFGAVAVAATPANADTTWGTSIRR